MAEATKPEPSNADPTTRKDELIAFSFLAVVIWPCAAVAIVGGFGFLIWMIQLVFGPPGAPG
ncbi:MAG: periplasmic nitrate reductase, NapE protein [Rhodospirillales bacterium]